MKRLLVTALSLLLIIVASLGHSLAQNSTPSLFVSLNPTDIANDAILSVATDLSSTLETYGGFTGLTNIQSVKIDSDDDAYITADIDATTGAIVVVDNLAVSDSAPVGAGSRIISGATTTLSTPKGLEIVESLNLVLVANLGANNIIGFNPDATGDVAPSLVITNIGAVTGGIWDIHYDETSDILFAAGTTGTLLRYDNFSTTFGTGGPTSLIVPTDAGGTKLSVNLHGVDYDAASDKVILTDVGLAADATDGKLFVLSNASTAIGNVAVDLAVAGPLSRLGNPVDVVFDGTNIYIAEKSNDAILYYADILSLTGSSDTAATTSYTVTKPESITIYPEIAPATEILNNGGFESDLTGWTLQNASGDKVKCNDAGKVFAYEGDCALRFKGKPGENAKLVQTITSGVEAGDTLTLSGFVSASGAVNGKLKVSVEYTDGTTPASKIVVKFDTETGGVYQAFSEIEPALTTTVSAAPASVKVVLKNKGETGKVLYDALSLTAQ